MIPAGEYLEFLSIDKWTIIFNLINTFILYKILKKFLFVPVNKMIKSRKEEIGKEYKNAQLARVKANELKNRYEDKIKNVDNEVSEIIKAAKLRAEQQSNGILERARHERDILIKRTQQEMEVKYNKATIDLKNKMADIVVLAAAEIINKEVNKDQNIDIIDNIFDEVVAK